MDEITERMGSMNGRDAFGAEEHAFGCYRKFVEEKTL